MVQMEGKGERESGRPRGGVREGEGWRRGGRGEAEGVRERKEGMTMCNTGLLRARLL